ncbi:alanine racemase [Filifactor alocis]
MRQYGATWAEINLDTLEQNYKNLKQLITHKTKVCCVLKANAYGHGSVEIAKLYENMGIDYIAVSNMDEALELRNAGIKLPITCLSFVPEYQYEELLKNNIDIPIYTLSQGIALNNIALKHQKVASVHIKIDSGMSRIGFLCNDMAIRDIKQLSRLDGLHFKGIFTHIARADERDKFHTQKQFYVFSKLIQSLEKQNITFDIRHCCNTAATICYPEYHLDMVRLGIALFGYYPSKEVSEKNVNIKPAMSLFSTISNLKVVEKGTGVSYGHKYIVQDDYEKIATIPIGYADGFSRALSNNCYVKIKGDKYPIVGNVCMDQSMIRLDISKEFNIGDKVVIYSDEQDMSVERLAKVMGTISYEVLCMMQRRIPRIFRRKGKVVKVVDYLRMR